MKYTEETYKYFSGEKFSTGYSIKLENNKLYSRTDRLLELVKNSSVIHVGCCDHLSVIDEKIKRHSWLQGLLEESCERVLGIDINQEAVDYVNKKNYSKHPVICGDVTSTDFSQYLLDNYSYCLLGEILEHVDNPVAFLKSMKLNLSKSGFVGKYIITVPNAFCFLRGKYPNGYEGINSDHRYWFTPFTIGKVMYRAGIEPEELYFVDYSTGLNGCYRLTNYFFRLYKKLAGVPSSFKSFRGGGLVAIGQ